MALNIYKNAVTVAYSPKPCGPKALAIKAVAPKAKTPPMSRPAPATIKFEARVELIFAMTSFFQNFLVCGFNDHLSIRRFAYRLCYNVASARQFQMYYSALK